ncbi:hypothetical protein EIP91_000190 [Steccherinum ochraceum]|uniref:FAD-binding domain-containing protein n=1 Tax=Steccherinum ochraceum TaxID=92696 RepID=A0A4R0RT54_9APHY|nr:hypothetical protein EIP91_000190 [Steccherinum ochraceum]
MAVSTPPRKLRVAVVGGGIGGLTFAIALSHHAPSVDIDIYESASTFGMVGAGIGMWPRVWDALKAIGLKDELDRYSASATGAGGKQHYRKADQAEGITFGTSMVDLVTIHRPDFLRILLESGSSSYRTHFQKRLLNYHDSGAGPITLNFKDGTVATCDVLVGADGIKSVVRTGMYEQLASQWEEVNGSCCSNERSDALRLNKNPTWTGQVVYRSLIPTEVLARANPTHHSLSVPTLYVGKNKYIITYPISGGKLINTVALVSKPELNGTIYSGPLVEAVSRGELMDNFVGWEPQVQTILNLMEKPLRWVINSIVSLPSFVSGRVVLLGDAAHAMTPHQASGAGQAIEDGLVLASLLARPETTRETLPIALQTYDEIRRPFSQDILRRSYETGQIYYLQSRRMKDVTAESSANGSVSTETLEGLCGDLREAFRWTWSTAVTSDCDQAVDLLRRKLQKIEA